MENCEEFPLHCPNGCSREGEDGVREVKRKDIPVHLDNHCPLQKVQCPYWDHGCRYEMERIHTDTHEREFLHIHFKLSLIEIKQKLIESTHNLDTSNEKIAIQEESLKSSRAELNAATKRIAVLEKQNSDKDLNLLQCYHISFYNWPIRYKRTIVLINQINITDNLVKSYEIAKENLEGCPYGFNRATEIRNYGFGFSFISNTHILEDKYCKQDSITLHISWQGVNYLKGVWGACLPQKKMNFLHS